MSEHPTDVFSLLSEPVRRILAEAHIEHPTDPQSTAIPLILAGKDLLLLAPTGSGKTEAAVLPLLSELSHERPEGGIYLLYITPLRALNRDMVLRLGSWCSRLGFDVEVRHGDTPQRVRRKQAERPPHILITTPESFQALIVNPRMREALMNLRWVIIDEVHEIAESRRGVQLSVGLERLAEIRGKGFQRIGLSATVGDPESVGRLISGEGRRLTIVESQVPKGYSYWVEWPTPTPDDFEMASVFYTTPEGAARISRIGELTEFHTSTLVFVNSRQIAEMLTLRLSALDKGFSIHHGSLSKEQREKTESDFKAGKLKAIVCTSTLELGIDIGSVDLVIQYLSPRQVCPLIQRVGRSGHRLDLSSKGVIISGFVDDAMESVAAARMAAKGQVEKPLMHKGALDVLAHQILGMALDSPEGVDETKVLEVLRRSHAYADLSDADYEEVAGYLHELGLIVRQEHSLSATGKGRLHYLKNISMIPDERRYQVWDVTSESPIGTVGDEFVETRARVGLNFICRGSVWTIESISEDGRVLVTPVEDPTAALPGWDGEIIPVSSDLARGVGTMRRRIADTLRETDEGTAMSNLAREYPADKYAIEKMVELIKAQLSREAPVPSDQLILVEGYENYVVVNSCFGERTNRVLGLMLERMLSRWGIVRNWWCDGYRILFELAVDADRPDLVGRLKESFQIPVDDLDRELRASVEEGFPLGYYMKFVAERFGAMERGLFLSENTLSRLAKDLRGTPIYKETLRQVMLENVDIKGAREIISDIQEGRMQLVFLLSKESPTPISSPILYRFAELPELVSLELSNADTIERTRNAIMANRVNLVCLECGNEQAPVAVKELAERPRCPTCGSSLMAPMRRRASERVGLVKRRLANEKLEEQEVEELSRLRRAADVVLSYGRRGVMALSVYGVGPQTASKVLSKMQYEERDLIRDLLEAKLRYVQTRRFWD